MKRPFVLALAIVAVAGCQDEEPLGVEPIEDGMDPIVSATIFIRDDAAGGDCGPVGTWDAATKTCTLTTDVVGTIQIDNTGVTLDCAGHKITGPGSPGTFNSGVFLPADGVTVSNCEISGFQLGSLALFSNAHTISSNTVHDNIVGILHFQSGQNTITNNTVHDNRRGIQLRRSGQNAITNNVLLDNSLIGLFIFGGDDNVLTSNTIIGPTEGPVAEVFTFGLEIEDGTNYILRDNEISGYIFNFKVFSFLPIHFEHDIDLSNTVDGKPIVYLIGASNLTVDNSSGAGTVYCIRCDNVVIENLTLRNNSFGVTLVSTRNSTVRGITVDLEAADGILLLDTDDNVITGNELVGEVGAGTGVTAVQFSVGILGFHRNEGNLISSNVVVSGFGGILFWGGSEFPGGPPLGTALRNTIRDNFITGPRFGIDIRGGDENIIEHNTLQNTGGMRVGVFDGVAEAARRNIVRENLIENGKPDIVSFNPSGGINLGVISPEGGPFIISDNVITGNVIRNVLDFGIRVTGASGNEISRNEVIDNQGNGIELEDAVGNQIFQNDIFENTGFQVSSNAAAEISFNDIGNFWGRECDDDRPLMIPGVDSNRLDVVDSHPFDEPIADEDPEEVEPPEPCEDD